MTQKTEKPDLSIIILTWNGEDVIKPCLDSIFREKYPFKMEVLIVDNDSRDKTKKIIYDYKKKYSNIRIKENDKNYGFPKGNNIGIKMAKGKNILLLNQDIEFTKNALLNLFRDIQKKNPLIKKIEKQENIEIGVIAPKLVYPDGKAQNSLRPFPTPINVLIDSFSFGFWHSGRYDLDKSQVVDQPMASCLLVKGEIMEKIKGFDTDSHFFLFFNDTDLSKRIVNLGYRHFYDSKIKVIHHHGQSTSRWPKVEKIKVWCRGLYYFLVKHYSKESKILKFILYIETKIIYIGRILFGFLSGIIKKPKKNNY